MTGPYPWGFQQEARDAARDDHAALAAENEKLREALRFYADERHVCVDDEDDDGNVYDTVSDYGEVARAALGEDE